MPLSLIFEGRSERKIKRTLEDILLEIVYGYCQSKGSMENHLMLIWMKEVRKPYVAAFGNFVLLLEGFVYHKRESFLSAVHKFDTYAELINGGYTCMSRPCDDGVMYFLKLSLKKLYVK